MIPFKAAIYGEVCCHGSTNPILNLKQERSVRAISPVQRDGSEAEHSDRTEEPVEELDSATERRRVNQEAVEWAGIQEHIEGHAHQAGADSRACQVLNKAPGDCLEDVGSAGAPQHGGVAWDQKQRCNKQQNTQR